MKKTVLIISISILMFSCEKTYNCVIITEGLENPNYYKFKGSHKEMKEFENSAADIQTIKCK